MTALSAAKNVREMASGFSQLSGDFGGGALEASAVFYTGALIAFDQSAQTLAPASTATDEIAVGVYTGETFTQGASGAPTSLGTNCKCGIFEFENSAAADAIANDDAGKTCYIVDDQTVALTDGGATRSVAGKIVKVDSSGTVWVAINPYTQQV